MVMVAAYVTNLEPGRADFADLLCSVIVLFVVSALNYS